MDDNTNQRTPRKKTPPMVKATAALAALTGCLMPDTRSNNAPMEGDPPQTPPAQKLDTPPKKDSALPHRPPPSKTRWRATKLFADSQTPGEDEPGRGV